MFSITLAHLRSAALVAAALSITGSAAHAGHVYAGLIDTNGTPGLQAGDALSFVNNSTGAVVTGESLGVQTMDLATAGPQSGLYLTSNISFTALSNGLNWTGTAYRAASPYAATSGSLLQLQVVSVTGPLGGEFSFWDESISTTEPAFTFTIGPTGGILTSGSGIFNLTDLSLIVGDGVTASPAPTATNDPPVDPYGHLHGRSFTTSVEGDYTVSYVIHDADTASPHPDSAAFVVSYQAVPEPTTLAFAGLSCLAVGAFFRRRVRH